MEVYTQRTVYKGLQAGYPDNHVPEFISFVHRQLQLEHGHSDLLSFFTLKSKMQTAEFFFIFRFAFETGNRISTSFSISLYNQKMGC